MHKQVFLFLLVVMLAASLEAQPKLQVQINQSVQPGDSIRFSIQLPDSLSSIHFGTIHLWIESINSGQRWHYKYPLLRGRTAATLVTDSALATGDYAFNFLLQKDFFRLKGSLLNGNRRDTAINYVLLSKTQEMSAGKLKLDADKFFIGPGFLFEDTAAIFYSRPDKALPEVEMINDIDSFFIPLSTATMLVQVAAAATGKADTLLPSAYHFVNTSALYKTVLPEVVIKTKSKKLADQFIDDNVSPLFSSLDGYIIDGLESEDLGHTNNLLVYLTSRIAGLNIKNNDDGTGELMWRHHLTDIYIDEVKSDAATAALIMPADIAIIKMYQPGVPVSFGSAQGGTIAVYMKKGVYKQNQRRSNHFYINGYTAPVVKWVR